MQIMQNSKKYDENEIKATIKIQNAWRIRTAYLNNRESVKDYCITQPIVVDRDKIEEQYKSIVCDDILSEIPEELRKYFDIVSHDTFLENLKKSFSMALKDIGNEAYSFMYTNNIQGENTQRKSEHWVVGELLKEDVRFQPKKPTQQNCEAKLLNKPEQKHILVFDDASYSGTQISDFIRNSMAKDENLKGCVIHFVIPFMSKDARDMIQNAIKESPSININNIKIHSSGQIFHINERLEEGSDAERELLENFEARETDLNILYAINYTTILAHKQADALSLGRKAAKNPEGSIALYKNPETRMDFKDYWENRKIRSSICQGSKTS